MNTPDKKIQDAQDDGQSSARPDGIEANQSEIAAERCLEVLMLASNYRVPESILFDTCRGLGISRALLLFKDSEISQPVLWNGSETVFADIDADRLSAVIEEVYDYCEECTAERACETHLSFLKEAPFNFESPVAHLIGSLEGILIIDSWSSLSQNAGTTLAAIGWLLESQCLRTQLRRERHIDWLTGLPVRWYFEKACHLQIEAVKALSTDLSIAIADIDNLRNYNDRFSLSLGDYVIKVLAQRLQSHLPKSILCCRIGGNCFGILAQGYSADKLFDVVEAVRMRIAQPLDLSDFGQINSATVPSVSFGIAQWKEPDTTYGDIMERADKALLQAKRRGRNQSSIN